MSKHGDRFSRNLVDPVMEKLTAEVAAILGDRQKPEHRMLVCGSYRRGLATIGDVDLVVDGTHTEYVSAVYKALEGTAGEVWRTKAGRITGAQVGDVPVELYVSKPGAWGAQTLFSTGSAAFNCKQRATASRAGALLNQYGLHREVVIDGKRCAGEVIAAATEEEIFEALKMRYVPPCERG